MLCAIVKNTEITEVKYKMYEEQAIDSLKKFEAEAPFKKAEEVFSRVIYSAPRFTSNEMLSASSGLNYNIFMEKVNQIVLNYSALILINGSLENNIKEEIKDLLVVSFTDSEKGTFASPSPISNDEFSQKAINGSFIYRAKNDLNTELNSVVTNIYQVSSNGMKESIMAGLIEACWEEIYYNKLRTELQLGYIVASFRKLKEGINYYVFIVQGNKENADQMSLEIDKVTDTYMKPKIEAYTLQSFDHLKELQKQQINLPFNNLKEKNSLIWREIEEGTNDFNRRKKANEILKELTLNDFKAAFTSIFYENPNRLSIRIDAPSTKQSLIDSEQYFLNNKIESKVISGYDFFKDHNTFSRSQQIKK